GGDPQVAFGLNGTAYFCALSFVKDDDGRTRAGLHFYRSEDGGITWGPKIDLGYSYDHEQIVVDHTYGKYAGRIYVATLYGYPEYQVGVFRSDDDGRTWVGPVKAASGLGKIGINSVDPLILSDETLILPYIDFPFEPEKRKLSTTSTIWTVASPDGGVTFAPPKKVVTQVHDKYEDLVKQRKSGSFVASGFPSLAADAYSEKYKDRLYVAWGDVRFGKLRILFSYSKDRGATWTEPKLVCGEAPAWASQFLPELAVNRQGVIGVTWYDTRDSEATDRCRQYFAASIDGGETFLPAVSVSSEPSFPRSEVNLIPVPMDFALAGDKPKSTLRLSTLSAYSRWGMGGDYQGLAPEPDGTFRVFWADTRHKAFQIYTAPVKVVVDEEKPQAAPAAGQLADTVPKPVKTEQLLLSNEIQFAHDPVRYDPQTGVATLSVRLRNVSKERIFGPLKVKVKGFVDEEMKKYQPDLEPNVPEILNSSNGEKGPGAIFDYAAALRDFEALDPGAATEAVEWKLKFSNWLLTDFFIEAEVVGFMMKAEEQKK
ncbi:MAG: sialidase family protein, partial [Acidobacteriota bacterium]